MKRQKRLTKRERKLGAELAAELRRRAGESRRWGPRGTYAAMREAVELLEPVNMRGEWVHPQPEGLFTWDDLYLGSEWDLNGKPHRVSLIDRPNGRVFLEAT